MERLCISCWCLSCPVIQFQSARTGVDGLGFSPTWTVVPWSCLHHYHPPVIRQASSPLPFSLHPRNDSWSPSNHSTKCPDPKFQSYTIALKCFYLSFPPDTLCSTPDSVLSSTRQFYCSGRLSGSCHHVCQLNTQRSRSMTSVHLRVLRLIWQVVFPQRIQIWGALRGTFECSQYHECVFACRALEWNQHLFHTSWQLFSSVLRCLSTQGNSSYRFLQVVFSGWTALHFHSSWALISFLLGILHLLENISRRTCLRWTKPWLMRTLCLSRRQGISRGCPLWGGQHYPMRTRTS